MVRRFGAWNTQITWLTGRWFSLQRILTRKLNFSSRLTPPPPAWSRVVSPDLLPKIYRVRFQGCVRSLLKAGIFLPKSRLKNKTDDIYIVVHSNGCSPILSLRLQDALTQVVYIRNKVVNKDVKSFRVSIWGVPKSLFSVMVYTVTHILMTELVWEQLQTIETCSKSSPCFARKAGQSGIGGRVGLDQQQWQGGGEGG